MKKIYSLKSLWLITMLVLTSASWAQVSKTYVFNDYPAGTQYAKDEAHKLDDDVTIYTTDCHFTSELRVYSSSANNGFFYSNELPNNIENLKFNIGYKADKLAIFGSNDGKTWSKVGEITTTSGTYVDKEIEFVDDYKYFKGDVVGTNQMRIKSITITYKSGSASTLKKPSVTYVNPGDGTLETNPFLEQASYEITNPNTTGAIFYSIDDTNWNEYTTAVTLTNSCTLKAKIKDGAEESGIASIEVDILPKENTFTTLVDLKAKGTHATDFIGFMPDEFHYVSGGKSNHYILKGNEMMLVYGSNLFPENLKTGDQLTGKFIGNYIDFNGKSEITNVQIAQPIQLTEANVSIDPTISVLTADQIAADYKKHEHKLITVIGLQPKSDIDYSKVAYGEYTQGENTLIVRNTLKDLTSTVSANKTYNITGHLGIYSKDGKTEYQIYPRSEEDIVESTETGIDSAKDNTFAISMTPGAVVITTNIETIVRIFQTSGQLIKTTTIPAGDTTIALPSGVYIINGKKAVVL